MYVPLYPCTSTTSWNIHYTITNTVQHFVYFWTRAFRLRAFIHNVKTVAQLSRSYSVVWRIRLTQWSISNGSGNITAKPARKVEVEKRLIRLKSENFGIIIYYQILGEAISLIFSCVSCVLCCIWLCLWAVSFINDDSPTTLLICPRLVAPLQHTLAMRRSTLYTSDRLTYVISADMTGIEGRWATGQALIWNW